MSCGKLAIDRSRGRQPSVRVSTVTTIASYPAASARCTKLSHNSRSWGGYSWNHPGVSPSSAATSSIGSSVSVDAIIGMPVVAAARAVTRSPCPSGSQRAITPTGANINGVGNVRPNSSTDRSRSAAPTSIRGISAHRSNASTLARCVRSLPAPPATYDHTCVLIASSARRSSSA